MSSYYTRILLYLLAIHLAALPLAAQPGLNKANTFFEEGAFREAIRRYNRILKKNESLEARVKLARSYKAIGELEKAEAQFAQAVFHPQSQPAHKFELGRLLKSMGKYAKAQTWFEKYADESPDPALGMRWAESCAAALDMKQDSLGYRILLHPQVNSKASEISPVFYKTGIAFASARKRGFLFRSFNRKSKLPFYDLYLAPRTPEGRLKKPVYLRQNLNTKLHDGPAVFNKSESVAFVTRSNTGEMGGKRDAQGYNRVNIYRIENRLDRWRKGVPVPFNSKEYNVAHPAITRDGETLYFASDMPGGYGGTDLYVSYYRGERWTQPENLGPEVNGPANEGYPFLTNDSTLYFSSDRAEGFGGKDIFYAHLRNGAWTAIQNAGYPLNSPADDFSFCMTPNSPYGYFASNRKGAKGDDDIFGFRRYKGIDGVIVDAETGEPLDGVKVEIEDINRNIFSYLPNTNGQFRHYFRSGQEILIRVTKEEYYDYRGTATVRELGYDENLNFTVALQPVRKYEIKGTVAQAEDQTPLPNALVRIIGTKEERSFSGTDGVYEREIKPEVEYTTIYYKEGFVPQITELSTIGEVEPKTYVVDAELEPGEFILMEGHVRDQERGISIRNANIHIFDPETQRELQSFDTREDGLFFKILNPDLKYSIVATKPDYLSTRVEIIPDSLDSDTVQLNLELFPLEPNRVVKVIYHAYNETNTDIFGLRDLNEIAYLMLDNPEISVELSSHTDSRGGAKFNKKLSQTRADAAAKYLISKGITADRIIARGYGEERLFNNCRDGKSCSEELHAQNRRTEVKIIRIDAEIKQEKEERNQETESPAPVPGNNLNQERLQNEQIREPDGAEEGFIQNPGGEDPEEERTSQPQNEWLDRAKEWLENADESPQEDEPERDPYRLENYIPGAKMF
ncbi:MAG: OmpA family protein [Bacteroidota bacterium]